MITVFCPGCARRASAIWVAAEGEPSRCMEDQVDWNVRGRAPDRTEHFLAVIDIDIMDDRNPEQAYGLLPVNEGYHLGLPFLPETEKKSPPGRIDRPPLHHRDNEYEEDDKDEDDNPEDIDDRPQGHLVEKGTHGQSGLSHRGTEKGFAGNMPRPIGQKRMKIYAQFTGDAAGSSAVIAIKDILVPAGSFAHFTVRGSAGSFVDLVWCVRIHRLCKNRVNGNSEACEEHDYRGRMDPRGSTECPSGKKYFPGAVSHCNRDLSSIVEIHRIYLPGYRSVRIRIPA